MQRNALILLGSLALAGCCTTNQTAPRTALPGITEPVEERPGANAPVDDRRGPRVAVVQPRDGAKLNYAEVPVVLRVEGEGVLRVDVNGVPALPEAEPGLYRATVVLREGRSIPIVGVARDQAGREGKSGVLVDVDSQAPKVQAQSIVVVNGRVDTPGTTVTVNGRPVAVQQDLTWETEVSLVGSKTVTVIATDTFGNQTVKVLDYSQ